MTRRTKASETRDDKLETELDTMRELTPSELAQSAGGAAGPAQVLALDDWEAPVI